MKPKYHITIFLLLFCLSTFAQMEFVENKGQWDSKVKYRSEFSTGAFYLEDNGFTVQLFNAKDVQEFAEMAHNGNNVNASEQRKNELVAKGLRSHVYHVDFLGSNLKSNIIPEKSLNTHNNYFIGNDPTKWAAECKVYGAVTYENIYPNIDLRFYTDAVSNLKYDLIVKPGGNPNQILMKYTGVDNLSVKNKELIVKTSVGDVKELYPYSYQNEFGKPTEVECKYVIEDDVVRFKVKNYNYKETLVIDPSLIFCSFTGSRADNWGYSATPGPNGSLFAGGTAWGIGYPTTTGAGYNGGSYDIAIFQFSSNGSQRIYATYIGGNDKEQPHSLIAKADGSLIIAGRSNSTNYPTTFSNGSGGGYDIVVTKLNSSGAITGSAKIGGSGDDGVNINDKDVASQTIPRSNTDVLRRNYGDDARSEVILDGSGNIYVASCTKSNNYPTKNAVQNTFGGGRQDGVIIKLDPTLSSVLFNTYFGGNGDDACFVLDISPTTGDLYVAGGTSSNNLLGDKTGVLQPTFQGGVADGYVTILKPDGSAIVKTTYQGLPNSADIVYGLKFDKKGFPYTMGTTTGAWPVINAPYSNANAKQFITKLQPDLSAYVYSTVFGAPNSIYPNISPTAFLVDRCENVYVSGWGGVLNSNQFYFSSGTANMPLVSQIPGLPNADGSDFYFFVLERDAQRQLFGSHFGQNGGNSNDHVDGGTSRFDANGFIYQGVCANCYGGAAFPTTIGSWATRNGTGNSACNQAVIKIEMDFTGVAASIKPTNDKGVINSTGCLPFTVTFTDTLAKGKTYIWDFGDGSPRQTTTAPVNSVQHTYNAIGRYRAMVISLDPTTCNVSDTAYVTIKVGNNAVQPSFNYKKIGPCTSFQFEFENTSTADDPSKFTATTFTWDFGDGTPLVKTGLTPNVVHSFPGAGTYPVRLIINDTSFCNAPISKDSLLRISTNVDARFSTPASGCKPYDAVFRNESIGGVTFIWEFGDGQTSTDASAIVTHLYDNVGTYKVRLIAFDNNTCNKVDTSDYFTIKVIEPPIAKFDWSPNPPLTNTPTKFTNLSIGANRYLWYFGDTKTSTDVHPTHLYDKTDDYYVELIAYNEAGCSDTFDLTVPAIIDPLLDVPNAFTPGKFGTNGIVKVVGFGIIKMNWKIYNRWGQIVFQTENRNQGWDGTFKGVLQTMDVYTYTLDVELSDGRRIRKTGDISLLR